jgi:hypothetical protein
MLLFRDLITIMAQAAKIFDQIKRILVISQVSYQSGLMIGSQKPMAIPDCFLRNRVPKFDSKLAVAHYGLIICNCFTDTDHWLEHC